MTFPPEVWDGALRRLQARVAPISFDRWLSEIDAAPNGEAFELRCPTKFHCDRIREYFLSDIEFCLGEELGRRVPLLIKIAAPTGQCDDAKRAKPQSGSTGPRSAAQPEACWSMRGASRETRRSK